VVGWARTQEEWDSWIKRDPIVNFRRFLLESQKATESDLKTLEDEVDNVVQEAVEFTKQSPNPDPATVLDHVFSETINPQLAYAEPTEIAGKTANLSWMDAVRDGVAEEMRRDQHILYFGEGIGDRGGCFGHTKNLFKEFGGERVVDTPICELGFTGAAIGASATGCRTVSDLMMADFLFEAASQIIQQGSKLRYMSNGQVSVPVVIRSGGGCIKQTGPHHSGMYHPIWAHCPGLIVVVPSNGADAKGLMKTALHASDPVVFIEQKALLSAKCSVPVDEYFIPFGKASVPRKGTDLTIVSCGLWLVRSLEAAEKLAAQGISCEVIDLRTIVPLDVDTIIASVSKTGRILVVDEGYSMCGIGAEIAAVVMEHAFDELDAPVGRLHIAPVPHPFSPPLEDAIIADVDRIVSAARSIVDGHAPIQPRAKAAFCGSSSQSSVHSPAVVATPTPEVAKKDSPDAKVAAKAGIPVVMPNMDLIITEATVVSWMKKVGDTVKKGEPLLEIETDKAVSNVESPADGILIEILAEPGSVVPLGQRLGTIQP
jgi:2-oxoisovalerate dehydrogenase E1 component